MDPGDVPIDDFEAPAGLIVALVKVFLEHSLAESGIVPRYLLALDPGFRRNCTIQYV